MLKIIVFEHKKLFIGATLILLANNKILPHFIH